MNQINNSLAETQIVFNVDGYMLADSRHHEAYAFEMEEVNGRWVYPEFEGQVFNPNGQHFGIKVVPVSQEELAAAIESEDFSDVFLTDYGQAFKTAI